MTSGKQLGQLITGEAGSVTSVVFGSGWQRIVSGSRDGTLRVWAVATGEPIGQPFTGQVGSVTSVAFSPDGQRILIG